VRPDFVGQARQGCPRGSRTGFWQRRFHGVWSDGPDAGSHDRGASYDMVAEPQERRGVSAMCGLAIRWLILALPGAVPSLLLAQTLGVPLSYRRMMSGFGVAVDAGGDKGGFRTLALTGIVALGHVTVDGTPWPLFNVSGTVARLSGESSAVGGSAVSAEVALLGSFAIGFDRSRWAGLTRTYIPLAAALPILVCAESNRIFDLYAVPVWNFERLEQPGAAAWQPPWGSVNLGASFELRSGLGFQVTMGGLFQDASDTPDPYRRVVISLGVRFTPHGILKAVPAGHRMGCGFAL